MALVVELLGSPRVARDGVELPAPRGRKTWAVLAYLLLADRPPSRDRLAGLLFPEADDPLGALRWSLSDLRRTLGSECIVGGDPVVLSLPATAIVDVTLFASGRWEAAVDAQGLGHSLLEGMDVSGSAAFEMWLSSARRRLDGAAEAVLHDAAMAALVAGSHHEAVGFARRLVELCPLDEAHHVLLVQCLCAAGDRDAATRHVELCTELFARELEVEPSRILRDALTTPVVTAAGQPPASVQSMFDAGESAVSAGAVSQGIRTLREAAGLARHTEDYRRLALVLVALGHALVDAGLGGDEEGGAILREAADCALETGQDVVAAAAHRVLAYADLQRGRYPQVHERVALAAELARGSDVELAWIASIAGAALSDQGQHAAAFDELGNAIARAQRSEAPDVIVFARTFLGRLHLLRGELAHAGAELEQATHAARLHWRGLEPWPQSLLAETELRFGDLDSAQARLERAFVMGRQLDDPCLQSISTRGLGLVAVARGQIRRGYRLLIDAPRLSRQLPDTYRWIEAYGLDALCAVAIKHDPAAAPRWVADLESLAARCGMRELLARALLHRSRLGDHGASDMAMELAATIDNPALHADLSAATV